MTELWCGVIDSRLDALHPTNQKYSSYVLSGTRRITEQVQNDDDDDVSSKERIILCDRDLIVFPHVGACVHVAVDVADSKRCGIPTYIVRRVVFFRPCGELTRSVLTRGLTNGIWLCRARIERARVADEKATSSRDPPVSRDTSKLVTELIAKPSSEMSLLLKDAPRSAYSLFSSVCNYYATRHIIFDALVHKLWTALKTRPITVPASWLHSCSYNQLETFAAQIEHVDPFVLLFGSLVVSSRAQFHELSLSSPLYLVRNDASFAQADECVRDALYPFSVAFVTPLIEFYRSTTNTKWIRDLTRQLKKRDSNLDVSDLDQCIEMHSAAMTAARYGATTFFYDGDSQRMESLRLWIRIPKSATFRRPETFAFTTLLCMTRAEQLAEMLNKFDDVSVLTIDGSVDHLPPSICSEVTVDSNRATFVVPSLAYSQIGDRQFTVDDVISAADWTVRAEITVTNVLVVLDAHRLAEIDFLHLLLAYMRLYEMGQESTALAERTKPKLVLIGDQWQKPDGWCVGSVFSDIVASGRYFITESETRRHRDVHSLAALASCAHFSTTSAEVFVDRLLTCRQTDRYAAARALVAAFQLVLWVPSAKLVGDYLGLVHESIRSTKKRSVSDVTDGACTNFTVELLGAVDYLRRRPHAIRDSVVACSPYIIFDGAVVRVANFYRLVTWPARNAQISVQMHLTNVVAKNGLISLDTDNLVLELSDETVDHRMCCDTSDANLMRVVCHRNKIKAASILLGRDAAHVDRLASKVAVGILPNAARNGPLLTGVTWHETAQSLIRLPPNASVSLLASNAVGNDAVLGRDLVSVVERVRPKTYSALDYVLKQ